jgi:hypothetical protein
MGQYQLWLDHREIDQNLRRKQITYKQELSKIDEHIARIENTAMQKNNALLTALMQQLKLQEHTTSKVTDAGGTKPEHNGATQANTNSQNYQTPPPSNYGQQNTSVTPALLTWDHRPNVDTQDRHPAEDDVLSADTMSVLPATTDHLRLNNHHPLVDPESQQSGQASLPWWLRNLMQITHEEQEPQPTAPIDQQSRQTNQHVERWFMRRTKLIRYNEWQGDQKK